MNFITHNCMTPTITLWIPLNSNNVCGFTHTSMSKVNYFCVYIFLYKNHVLVSQRRIVDIYFLLLVPTIGT